MLTKEVIDMKETRWGNEYRLTTVCIDSYENGVLTGRLYNPHLSEGQSFRSLTEFLKKMDVLLDEMNFPQSFSEIRTFKSSPQINQRGSPDIPECAGTLATFAVRILFRQNASWQGLITWLGQGKEQSFRSALELVFLMDSALCHHI